MSNINGSGVEFEPLRFTKLLRKYSECERIYEESASATFEERLMYEMKDLLRGQTWREIYKIMDDEALSQVSFRESLARLSQLLILYPSNSPFMNKELIILLVKVFLDESPPKKYILEHLFKESSSLHVIMKAVQNLLECLPDCTKQFLKRPRNCNEQFKSTKVLLSKQITRPDTSFLCDMNVSNMCMSQSIAAPVISNDESQILGTSTSNVIIDSEDTEKQEIPENSVHYTQVSSGLCEEINICISKFMAPESQCVQIHEQSEWCELYADETDIVLQEVTESQLFTLLLQRQRNSLICLPFGYTKISILLCYIQNRNFRPGSKMVYILFNKKDAVSITNCINQEISNRGVVAFALTDECQFILSTFKESKVIVTSLTLWEKFCRKTVSGNTIKAVSDLIIDEITWLYEDVSAVVEDIIFRSVFKSTSRRCRVIAFSLVLKSNTELAARKITKYLSFKPSGCDIYTLKHNMTKLNIKLVGINNKEDCHTKIISLCCTSVLERLKLNQKILILVENDYIAENIIFTLSDCTEMNKIISHFGFFSTNSKKYSGLKLPSIIEHLFKNGFLLLQKNMEPAVRDEVRNILMDGDFLIVVSTFDYSSFADIHVDVIIMVALEPDNCNSSYSIDVSSLSQFSSNTNSIEVINCIDNVEFIFRQLTGYQNSKRIVDDYVNRLNTEIVLGNIRSFNQACQWLQSTFSCVMNESLAVDVTINECLSILSNAQMIQFEDINNFLSSEIGRAASYYNIHYETINHFNSAVASNIAEILHITIKALEKERKEECKNSLTYLNNLAVYMQKLKSCNDSHIQDAVHKLMEDYFHYKIPGSCGKFILNRMVQFLKALSEISLWKRCFVMAYYCIKYWRMIGKLQFAPTKKIVMFDINVKVYISNNMYLHMEIKLLPKNTLFDHFCAGKPLCFWLLIRNQNYIYNYEYFHISVNEVDSGLVMNYIFPISTVKASLSSYNILIMSDMYPIYEQHLIVATDIDTTLHDEQMLTCFTPTNQSYSNMETVLRKLYKKCWKTSFLQVFDVLYYSQDSMLIAGFSSYGEKTITIETAIGKAMEEKDDCKVIYTASELSQIFTINKLLKRKWPSSTAVLTGNCQKQLDLFEQSRIIFVTWTHLNMLCETDMIQSYFKNGKVSLLIIDGIQEMTAELECAVIHSECRETNLRIIGLSLLPVGNILDVGHFLGVSEFNTFNFNQFPFKALILSELNLQGFSERFNKTWKSVMNEAVYKSILDHCPDKHPALIVVPSVQQLESTANELVVWKDKCNKWLYLGKDTTKDIISSFTNEIIGQMLRHGIGMLFKQMSETDKRTVQELYSSRKFKVLLTTEDMCKNIVLDSHLVILKGTKFCDKKENILLDLHPEDVSRLVGVSSVSCPDCTQKVVVILCQETKRQLYENYFSGPVLVESHVLDSLPLLVIYKIVRGSFINVADVTDFITNSFLALRIKRNKSLYTNANGLFTDSTDLAKSVIYKLQADNYVTVDKVSGKLNATVLGMVLVNHNLKFETTQLLHSKLGPKIALREIFALVCSAEEFKNVYVPHVSSYMQSQIPIKCLNCSQNLPTYAHRVCVLLQGYIFKCKIFPLKTIINDGILEIAQRVIQATVAVSLQRHWINSFLFAHELLQILYCQCLTVGISSLYYLPYMNKIIAKKLKNMKSVLHRFHTDPESLRNILAKNLTESCVSEMFAVLESYPKFEVSLYLYISEESTVIPIQQNSSKTPHKLSVNVAQEYGIFTEVTFSSVCKGTVSIALTENYVGKIVSFKKINCETQSLMLPITISSQSGKKRYSLYTLFSSFVGIDKKIDFTLHAVKATS